MRLVEGEGIDLVGAIQKFVYDPAGFVYFVYGWGEGVLKDEVGPDQWQREILDLVGYEMLRGDGAVRIAVASGNEIGKTALIAWVIHWFISTRPCPQIVVTANTATQLSTKTWRELSKWHKLSVHRDWFEWTATKFYMKHEPETWFAAAIPWSAERSQAFAGTHEKYLGMFFDEASTIEDSIWEQADQGMRENSLWLAFGNPTETTGRFRECFEGGRFRSRWISKHIDSRNCKRADQGRIAQQIEDYGEDSDYVRVHVKGVFPRQSSNQFISPEIVMEARDRRMPPGMYDHSPVVMGVDVARFGADQTVILVRRGGQILQIKKLREKDTMQVAGNCIEMIRRYNPQVTFVDEIGIGSGVVDYLRSMGYKIHGVHVGRNATEDKIYFNLRAECWGRMREWLKSAYIPPDNELIADLTGPEYGFDNRNRIQLEKKEDMKLRGLASPDVGDALALTFAMPVSNELRYREVKAETEFNVFEQDYGKPDRRFYS